MFERFVLMKKTAILKTAFESDFHNPSPTDMLAISILLYTETNKEDEVFSKNVIAKTDITFMAFLYTHHLLPLLSQIDEKDLLRKIYIGMIVLYKIEDNMLEKQIENRLKVFSPVFLKDQLDLSFVDRVGDLIVHDFIEGKYADFSFYSPLSVGCIGFEKEFLIRNSVKGYFSGLDLFLKKRINSK